jgi:hypothetical protein
MNALRTYLSGNKLSYQQVGQLVSRLKSVNPSTLESLVVGAGALAAAGANPFQQFVHESLKPDRTIYRKRIDEKFDFKIGEGGKIVIGKETGQPPGLSRPGQATMPDIFTEDEMKQSMENLLRKLRTAGAQQREKERIDPELKAQIKSNIEEIKEGGMPEKDLAKTVRDAIGTSIDQTTALTVVGMMDTVYGKGDKPAIKPSIGDSGGKPDTGKETTDIPIPIVGTDTSGKGKTKTKPREPGEDSPPPTPRLPKIDPNRAHSLAAKVERLRQKLGRMRPKFKRNNNTTIPEEEQEPGNDDLFGDDNEEVELILQEKNSWLNKFEMFEIDPEDPGTQAQLMDDGMKFYGDPNMYSSNCGVAGFSYSPDFGYVKMGSVPLA